MPDLSWTASLDVTHVSKALSKIDREAKELGVSFDKSFKTADEAVKYLQENISGLETALVRLKKEQSDVKLLPDSEGRTERLQALKIEIDDVTTSLRQNKKWQQDLSKAQKEDVGNTNTQINSFRSLFTIFQAGTKTSHSLVGGFKAINAALKANPFGVVLLAAAAVVGVFKKLYNSLQPVKNLVDGISNAFNSLGTSIANALGMETVSQHEAKRKQLEEQKEKLDDLKESVSDIDKEIDKLKEKNKTPKQRLSEIDSQISDYEKEVAIYQKMWDKKTPQWQKNNSSGVLATNLEGAKKQLELAKLQRDEIKKEIDDEESRVKKQAEELAKQRKSYLQALLDDSNNLKYAPRQREINWMEEGHDKVMAQIELDYEKEIDSIKKYESQKIAEYNKLYGKNYATIGELPQSVREPIQGVVGERTQNAVQQKEEAKELYAEQNRLKLLKQQLATVKNLTTWERSKLEAKKQELAASLELAKTDDERDSTSEKIKEIEGAITSLDEAQMRLDEAWGGNGIEKSVDNLKTIITLTKKQNSEVGLTVDETNELIDRESSLKDSVISVVESFSEFSNLISDLAEGGKMDNFSSGMSDVADVLSNTVRGFAQGGAIGGVISFLGTTLGKFAQIGKEAKKEYLQKQNDYQKSLYESSISYENYQSNSIFGSNALQSYKEASRALADYKKQLNNIQTEWYDFKNQKMEYSTALADYINPDGTVDENSVMQLEQKISTLSDGSEARKYFEQIQILLTEYGTAVEEENKAIVSMFQKSGTEISDSIVSAFDNGTNAMEAFGSSTGDIMNNVKRTILKNLIETDWYSKIESSASNLIAALQSESTTDDAIAEREWDIANKSFSESMSKYEEMYSRLGITSEGGTASTYSKGIAQASQDSVDELNGRFTAIQSHTYSINENMKEMQTRQSVILNEIMGIHTDTSSLKTMFINGTARVKIN